MAATDYTVIYVWSFVLIVVALVGFLAVSWMKRYVRRSDEPTAAGFSLDELRRLHQSGQLTKEEYDRAVETMVAAMKRPAGPRKPG